MAKTDGSQFNNEQYRVESFNSLGVPENDAKVFQILFYRSVLDTAEKNNIDISFKDCFTNDCDQELSAGSKAVIGQVLDLDGKLIITIALQASTGDLLWQDQMKIDRLSDLDIVAERMGKALALNEGVGRSVDLGLVTHREHKPEPRRETFKTAILYFGSFHPYSSAGYGEGDSGIALGLGKRFETDYLILEPKIGIRTDSSSSQYFEIPLDVGVRYLFQPGDVSTYLGAGAGLRLLREKRTTSHQSSAFFQTTTRNELEESAYGFAGFVEAGVLLMRTYNTQLGLALSHEFSTVEINDREKPRSTSLSLSVAF